MPKIFLLFLLFFIQFSFFQTLTDVVSDALNKPLENANVIAKPLQERATLKFSIADNKGSYKLELEKDVRYEIRVLIGFQEDRICYKNVT